MGKLGSGKGTWAPGCPEIHRLHQAAEKGNSALREMHYKRLVGVCAHALLWECLDYKLLINQMLSLHG